MSERWSYWPKVKPVVKTPEQTRKEAEYHRQFWQERLAEKDDPGQVRVGGKCYTIKPQQPPGTPWYFLGHAGRIFWIEKETYCTWTNNLWDRGMIPEGLRGQMPDNAKLLNEYDPQFWTFRKNWSCYFEGRRKR